MTRRVLLAGLAVVAVAALGACDLYFGSPGGRGGYGYCDQSGCYECDDWGCWSTGQPQPGDACQTNEDCAAGCYCDDSGVCQESGFCSRDRDCPVGFECDDRSTCVPEGTGPEPCTSHDQCGEGAYCDADTGECVDSGTCTGNDDCAEGMVCDTERGTCVPGEDLPEPPDPGSCAGDITCDALIPECPDGSTPGIKDGCFTGYCIPVETCDVPPPPTCPELTTEDACLARMECFPRYTGINCTDPQGSACTQPGANCTCESFAFAACDYRTGDTTPMP